MAAAPPPMQYPLFFAKALDGLEAAGRAVDRLLAPTDPAVQADPDLSKYASLLLSGAVSCAESAYLIAERLVAIDHGDRDHHRPLVLDLQAGVTLNEMRRRLQASRMRHFPLFVYNRALDAFVPASGDSTPRADFWAICFLPQDAVRPQAHWAFLQVQPGVAGRPQRPAAPWVIYTSVPLTTEADDELYWRCEVTPENAAYYRTASTAGWACDCPFRRRCRHEYQFLQRHHPRESHRVVMVSDNRRGGNWLRHSFVGSVTQARFVDGWRVSAAPANGLAITDPAGVVTRTVGGRDRATLQVGGRHFAAAVEEVRSIGPLTVVAKLFVRDRPARAAAVPAAGALVSGVCMSVRARVAPVFPALRSGLVGAAVCVPFGVTFGWWLFGARDPVDLLADAFNVNNWTTGEFGYPTHAFADFHGLGIVVPGAEVIATRLAMREHPDRHAALDTFRKVHAEHRHAPMDITHDAVLAWLDRVADQPGHTLTTRLPLIERLPPGHCLNCRQKRAPLFRGECRACKALRHSVPPVICMVPDCVALSVGIRGIWSIIPVLPEFAFKPSVKVTGVRGELFRTPAQFRRWFADQHVDLSCRGRNCGPMFLGQTPVCFPRAHPIAIGAFCVRLGAVPDVFMVNGQPVGGPVQAAWDIMLAVAEPFIEPLGPEPWEVFIDHFRGEKRTKMLEARADVNLGNSPDCEERNGAPFVAVRMSGFAKAEKSYDRNVADEIHVLKATQKPRFICSPNPLILARLGPYTHAQTKWLAKKFHWRSGMFYAGCATPSELNDWLNVAVGRFGSPWAIVDDISAIDASHSEMSFAFHRAIRHRQFAFEAWVEGAFNGEERIRARIGPYKVQVDYVNASGVSDTSYKNSLICIFARALAILHGASNLDTMSPAEIADGIERLGEEVMMTASGDDGLTYSAEEVFGTRLTDPAFLRRYREFWARLGFGVKVEIVPSERWRLATYLAMRPVWGGSRYLWAPEPARRLRGMFWQIDNTMHPTAWARGIARQVLGMSGSLTVMREICTWFLTNTVGPCADAPVFGNPHSPWAHYTSEAVPNCRADDEFCADYHVDRSLLVEFPALLASIQDVYVDINCQLIRDVFAAES